MPNQPKTKQSTYRFTDTELDLMTRLGVVLAPGGMPPLNRTDVLRVALHRLAAAELHASGPEKTSRKGRKVS